MNPDGGDEAGRLSALRRLDVLDTAPEAPFDKIVGLVRTVLSVPIATVTLVDAHRQWFKARAGLAAGETPRRYSFCTHTVAARAPLMIEDALLDARVAGSPLVTGEPHIRAYLGVPLITPDGHAVGALCALDTVPRTFAPTQVDLLANFANLVVDELELRQIAVTDQLTGAMSRRGFLDAAAREVARCRRYGRTGSIAMLDVDHFKRINDRHGHAAGDAVLRRLGSLCAETMRPNDVFGRLGGEEFAILLAETPADQSMIAMERLRKAIATTAFDIGGGERLAVTASIGVADLGTSETADAWLAAADSGLYQAKANGRNRTVVVSDIARG